jgi:tRNA (guanine-N7-)-methyltransferase
MARGKHPRYLKFGPLDESTIQHYLLRWHSEELYSRPETFPLLDSNHLFTNGYPLELEIGCGTGEFLCSLAQKDPQANFVGVEISLKPLLKAVDTVSSLALHNIRFIRANFHLMYPLLVPDSLRAVYLHFPDPSYKTKHRKRRILNSAFLDQMHRALIPEGRMSVMTDQEEFFMDMLALIEQDARFEKTHQERYLIGFENDTKSRYQHLWESRGLPTLRFEVQRRAT